MSEDRRSTIGGSDVAAIFGVSPWKTAFDLYEEKTAAEFVQPTVEPQREKLFRRGKFLEPWVLKMLESERDIFIVKHNQRYEDPEYPWMSCEIDFEYQSDAGLCNGDVKTVSPFAAGDWGEEGTDDIPISYCLQFMFGLMVTGRPSCLVAVLIGADDLRVYEVKRDEELIAEIRRRVVQFWTDNVLAKVPPPPQTIGDTNKILFKHGGFVSPGDEVVWESVTKLREVKAQLKALESEKTEHELAIKRYLVVQAEAMQVVGSPKKFILNDSSGKALVTVGMQHRSAYSVPESDFLVMRIK